MKANTLMAAAAIAMALSGITVTRAKDLQSCPEPSPAANPHEPVFLHLQAAKPACRQNKKFTHR